MTLTFLCAPRWARRPRSWAAAGLALAGLLGSGWLQANPAPAAATASADSGVQGFYRQPALRGNHVVFVAEGDLWRVGLGGGRAERLTTHPGQEAWPALSPDGRWLAFVGSHDGGADAYVMPLAGGVPRRLTWEGSGVRVWGFAATGEVLVTVPARSGHPTTQLQAVEPRTLARRMLPVAQASDGALSADGKRLYFTRSGLRGDHARQYRGGAIARLWVLELEGRAEARPLVEERANDRRPMPYRDARGQDRVAFLSDRDGTVNLWSVRADGAGLRQHTRHAGWDIRHAALDGTRVVYALGADLRVADLASDEDRLLDIRLGGDFEAQRQRWVARPQTFLTKVAMAPDGERVLLAARGRLATQGVGALRRAELPQPADGRCRDAVFSHDSRHVYALCDFAGEPEVWRLPANGAGAPVQITRGATAQRETLRASPDGRWLVHDDRDGRLWLTDLQAEGYPTRELEHNRMDGRFEDVAWSPDGSALAFTRAVGNVTRSQLVLLRLADGQRQVLTSDRYDTDSPAFSPDGRWLYFASNRHFAITGNSSPWGDRNLGPNFDRRTRLYALALQPGLRAPMAVPDELTPAAPANAPAAASGTASGAGPGSGSGAATARAVAPAASAPAPTAPAAASRARALPAIVWEGLAGRLHELPVAPGNYRMLRTDGRRMWLLDTEFGSERRTSLKTFALEPGEARLETVASEVREFELGADAKRMMVVRGAGGPGAAPEILLVEAGARLPAETARAQVRWSDWSIATDPKAEWRQMFADAWRMQREHFYDRDMHGVDWLAVRRRHEPLLERVTDRVELAELMAQMVSHLGALHSQVGAPDLRSGPEEPALASLGAELVREPGGWRIARILRGDPELPGEASPLAAPGLEIAEGDVITALNGRAAAEASDPAELLRGQAGRQVLLALRKADGRSVQAVVLPVSLARERQLRLLDWRQSRLRTVLEASQGRIGYLHLRAMGGLDMADFAREFYAHSDRDGLVIDMRFNSGGNIDSWVLEKLLRRAWVWWQRRSPPGSPPYPNMQQAFHGHLVVLVNEETYSDGETFSEGFKRLGLGTVIGRRTSGAGVWLSDRNRLLDNGIMRAAETGQMDAQGRFLIEGVGVAPDVEVDNPPRGTFEGGDAQLDAALAHLQRLLRERPVQRPVPGPYPRPVRGAPNP
ncbi:MAG: S41 family peptidase [Rubrivivax sp.]